MLSTGRTEKQRQSSWFNPFVGLVPSYIVLFSKNAFSNYFPAEITSEL